MALSIEFDATKFKSELASLVKSLDNVGTNTVSVMKKIKSMAKNMETVAKVFDKSGDKIAAASFREIAKSADAASKDFSVLKNVMATHEAQTKKSAKEIKNLSSQLNKVSESAEKQKLKLEKTITSTSKLLEKNTQLNTKLKETESNYKKSGKAISDSEKLLAKSQKTTEKLQKQYDNLSKKSKETSDTNQRLGGRVSYLTSEISKLEKQMRDTNKELLKSGKINLDLQKKNSTLGNSYIKINTENKKLQSELSTSRKEASKLTSEINRLNTAALKSGKANLELQKKVSALGNQMSKAKTEMKQSEQVIKHYEKATKNLYNENVRLTAKIEKQTAAYKKLRGEQNTLQSSMNRVMKIASTLRNAMFLVGVATAWQRISTDIVKVGSDFEMMMKTVGGATETIGKGWKSTDFKELTDLALKLGETTEYTATQAAEAEKYLAMAGFRASQIYATLPGVLDLATAGQLELGEASDLATNALIAMGLATADTTKLQENMARVNNALVFSAVQTNVSVKSIAESFKYVAPQAKNMGVQIEELTTWIGLLGNIGIEGSLAGTQLSFAFVRQAEAMKQLNMTVKNSTFLDMLKEMNAQGWGAAEIQKVFTARGSRAVLSLKDLVPVYERLLRAQKLSKTYAKDLADVMRDSTTVNFQKFKSIIDNIKIQGFMQGADRLNRSMINLRTTVTNNRSELEKVAKLFVDMESSAISLASKIVDLSSVLIKFYSENKGAIDSMTIAMGLLIATMGKMPKIGIAVATGGLVAKNFESEAKSIEKDIARINVVMKEQLDIKKKMQEADKDEKIFGITIKTPAYARVTESGVERVNAGDKGIPEDILRIDESIKAWSNKKQQLQDSLNKIKNDQIKIEDTEAYKGKKERDRLTAYAEQVLLGTQESITMMNKALDDSKEIGDSIDKLGEFGGKIKAKKGGGLIFVGGETIESQRSSSSEEIKSQIAKFEQGAKSSKESIDKYTILLEEAKAKLMKAIVPTKGSSDEVKEEWNAIKAEIQTSLSNISSQKTAQEINQENINKLREKDAKQSAIFDRQISEREYNRYKEGYDLALDSESKLFDLKKSYYENYENWSRSKSIKFLEQESRREISAQQEKINRMKKDYDTKDPASKISQSDFNKALQAEQATLSKMRKDAKFKNSVEIRKQTEEKEKIDYESLKNSEEALLQQRKSYFESFEQWSETKARNFREKELQNEIDALARIRDEKIKSWRNDPKNAPSKDIQKKVLKEDQTAINELDKEKKSKMEAFNKQSALTTFQYNKEVEDKIRELKNQTYEIEKANALEKDIWSTKNAEDYYRKDLQMAIDAELLKRNEYETTERARVGSGKLSEQELSSILKSWDENISKMLEDLGIKMKDFSVVTWKDFGSDLKSTMSSSLSGVLTDALTGELDSFEAYFSEFTNSLAGMWSSMASNMIINQQTLEGLSGLGTVGAMGAAGIGIMGVSSILSSREKDKAEKARKAALREQLKSELGDSIAQLELGDAGYQIYQLNEKIKDLTAQAKDAGYPMAEIIKLRKLETKEILDSIKAQYSSASTSMTDFVQGVIRDDWSMTDWQAEYDRLHEDLLSLDQTSSDYRDDSIDILNEQFEALKMIYDIQKEQLSALESLSESLTSQIWDLQNTDNMPTSLENFQAQYDKLMLAATTPGASGFINTEAVSDFQDFVSQYIDKFSAAGYDYQDIVSGVVKDLSGLQVDVQSESEALAIAIRANTEALEGDQGVINAINSLAQVTQEIANREIYKAWKSLSPDVSTMATIPGMQEIIHPKYQNFEGMDKYSGGKYAAEKAVGTAKNLDLKVTALMDWVNSIDKNISPNIQEWVSKMPTYKNFTDVSMADTNSDGTVTEGELSKYVFETQMKMYEQLAAWASDIPAFAKGGWSNSPSIFGETGYGEYAVPDKNNPNNAHFLQSVGVDSNEIGTQIGNIVSKAIRSAIADLGLNSGQSGDIVVKINEKEIARATLSQMKNNPSEYKRVLQ